MYLKNLLSLVYRPHSLMDKTGGFYPFDPGSSPGGGTEIKCQILCLVFYFGHKDSKSVCGILRGTKLNTQKEACGIGTIRVLVGAPPQTKRVPL